MTRGVVTAGRISSAVVIATVIAIASGGCTNDSDSGSTDTPAAATQTKDGITTATGLPECSPGPVPEEQDPEVAADPIEFDVQGDTAEMFGNIGDDIVHRVCDVMSGDPQLDVIEMVDVPGSSTSGNQTLAAGLVLRAGGIDTAVPGDGEIDSGAVDLFLAGNARIVADGGCLGVHSTEIDGEDGPVAAADLPRDDPEHQPFLDYFAQLGIPSDFYWFTLQAAPPEGIHYLTPEEMQTYEVTTAPAPSVPCPLADQ